MSNGLDVLKTCVTLADGSIRGLVRELDYRGGEAGRLLAQALRDADGERLSELHTSLDDKGIAPEDVLSDLEALTTEKETLESQKGDLEKLLEEMFEQVDADADGDGDRGAQLSAALERARKFFDVLKDGKNPWDLEREEQEKAKLVDQAELEQARRETVRLAIFASKASSVIKIDAGNLLLDCKTDYALSFLWNDATSPAHEAHRFIKQARAVKKAAMTGAPS